MFDHLFNLEGLLPGRVRRVRVLRRALSRLPRVRARFAAKKAGTPRRSRIHRVPEVPTVLPGGYVLDEMWLQQPSHHSTATSAH